MDENAFGSFRSICVVVRKAACNCIQSERTSRPRLAGGGRWTDADDGRVHLGLVGTHTCMFIVPFCEAVRLSTQSFVFCLFLGPLSFYGIDLGIIIITSSSNYFPSVSKRETKRYHLCAAQLLNYNRPFFAKSSSLFHSSHSSCVQHHDSP